ncbi:hypothetical protein K144316041_20420 [Clostridium tetani]|uniref:hypothetical protein n=1 Tax=Clostridium tetani TaxID=1513 RepID=UPI002953DB62|nr:hypothetical protein [Clostridium tetani]BDR73334.1 hypothetical protein K144316041_20420 [Clostridium tetani]
MINISRVINDPRFSQTFSIFRKSGEWQKGRFVQKEVEIKMTGVITVAKSKDIEMIPEGDRVGGELAIYSTQEIFTTRKGDISKEKHSGTSDELLWHGERYKIYSVSPYRDYGYYKAIAMRKASC